MLGDKPIRHTDIHKDNILCVSALCMHRDVKCAQPISPLSKYGFCSNFKFWLVTFIYNSPVIPVIDRLFVPRPINLPITNPRACIGPQTLLSLSSCLYIPLHTPYTHGTCQYGTTCDNWYQPSGYT